MSAKITSYTVVEYCKQETINVYYIVTGYMYALLTLAHARRVIVLSLFVRLSVGLSVCVSVRGFSPWPWQL